MFLSDLKLLINDFAACKKLNTSLLFPNGMPDRFVGCITSGQQLLNEQNFNMGDDSTLGTLLWRTKQLKDNTLKGRLWCTLLNVYDKLELLVCLTKNCQQNFLGGLKKHKFPVWNSKGSEKKLKIREGRRGEQFWRRGGGGDKMFMPPVIGYGYFLESPNVWKCGQRQT